MTLHSDRARTGRPAPPVPAALRTQPGRAAA
jgi:hypothetical protein